MTKVSADNDGRYHWQAGDKISVLNDSGDPYDFETEGGDSEVDFRAQSFDGTLGKYAMYPANSTEHTAVEDDIAFNLPSTYTWSANSTNMPMLGKISGDKATFKAVGGVLKLVCYNIPADAVLMEFSATNKQISGEFEIADGTVETPVILTTAKTSNNNIVNFDFTGNRDDNMVFYIPLPTGTIDGFTVSFYSDDPAVLFTKTTTVDLTVARNQMIIAPDLICDTPTEDILPNATIVDKLSGSYANVTMQGSLGKDWNVNACKQSSKMQLRKDSGSNIGLPVYDNNISSIILHGTYNASGDAYSGTITMSTAKTSGTTITTVTPSVSAGDDIVISVPSGYKTGYLLTSAGLRITSITVKFAGEPYYAPTITVADVLEIPVAAGETNNAETAVSTSNEIDALGLTATVADAAKSWLTATIDEGKLKVSAPKNTTGALREGKVTLRITGVSKDVTVSQPNALVPNPTDLTVVAGDAIFTATWTGDANATSYVAYLRTTDGTPTDGTNITSNITNDGEGNYSITDYAATNNQEYFLYVKVNGVSSNYVAPTAYAQESFTPAVAVLSSITVTTNPTKTTYLVGDTYSFEGAVVTATYVGGSTLDVTASCTTNGGSLMSSTGSKAVTVYYSEGGIDVSTTYNISVRRKTTLTSANIKAGTGSTSYGYSGLLWLDRVKPLLSQSLLGAEPSL